MNTMHVLAVNSVSTLLNYLTEQLQSTPSIADIKGWETPVTDVNANQEVKVTEENNQKVTFVFYFIYDASVTKKIDRY